MSEKQQLYKLKRGVVIQPVGTNQAYTRDNLTDEVAREYLDKYPHKANLFDVIPEEQAEVESRPKEQPDDKPKAKSKKT